jgi:hypothetical protein
MKNKMFWIKLPYWLGILADALWAIALFIPSVFEMLTGYSDFNPDLQIRLIMSIGGSLMTGWTFLLIWALFDPISRKAVGILTAFPAITGLSVVSVIAYLDSNSSNIWILFKLIVLFILFFASYVLAGNNNKAME